MIESKKGPEPGPTPAQWQAIKAACERGDDAALFDALTAANKDARSGQIYKLALSEADRLSAVIAAGADTGGIINKCESRLEILNRALPVTLAEADKLAAEVEKIKSDLHD